MMPRKALAEAEGDTNLSPPRRAWSETQLDEPTRALVQRDARVFLRQSVSTPCLSAIRHAEGIWIEDLQGRRYMDFHGNNVHHIGNGHPRLIDAIQRQMNIGDVRGRGCLMGAELVVDRTTRTPACDAAGAVLYEALSRSLNFKTTMGNVPTLTPPLIITERQMLQALEILEESIGEVELEMGITQS